MVTGGQRGLGGLGGSARGGLLQGRAEAGGGDVPHFHEPQPPLAPSRAKASPHFCFRQECKWARVPDRHRQHVQPGTQHLRVEEQGEPVISRWDWHGKSQHEGRACPSRLPPEAEAGGVGWQAASPLLGEAALGCAQQSDKLQRCSPG